MHLFDVPWINNEGGAIFSIDLHPEGKKLAIAGQDKSGYGVLTIWDVSFINRKYAEDIGVDEKAFTKDDYGVLTKIQDQKSFNCVRWNRNDRGHHFALCGDDPTIYIYEFSNSYTSHGSKLTDTVSSQAKTMERYKCFQRLTGHQLDVLHLEWSPDGRYLASCSLDATLFIWNCKKSYARIMVLSEKNGGHEKGIKGTSWDPFGRFLATQSDDELKLWEVDTWICMKTIRDPFTESVRSVIFSRMDWSPDGSYLIAPCSMNNSGPTAQLIFRKEFNYERDFVGFRKATTCIRANPYCFDKGKNGSKLNVSYFAIGSRDTSLSVWCVPNYVRPVLVLENLFKLSILDLTWHNYCLVACSRDGTIKIIKFDEEELGRMLDNKEMERQFELLYHAKPAQSIFEDSRLQQDNEFDFGYRRMVDLSKIQHDDEILPTEKIIQNTFNLASQLPTSTNKLILKNDLEKVKFYLKSKYSTSTVSTLDDKISSNVTNTKNPDTSKSRSKVGSVFVSGNKLSTGSLISKQKYKRVLAVQTQQGISVEVLNKYETGSESKAFITAYALNKKVMWSQCIPKFVFLLASNLKWTALITVERFLIVLITKTGRAVANFILEETPSFLFLNNNFLRVKFVGEGFLNLDLEKMHLGSQ